MIDLNRPAPTTEPERQYYFIKKVQEYVKAQSEKLGRPMRLQKLCTVYHLLL